MIEVFKTNVESVAQSDQIVQELLYHFPGAAVNFDLDDCDRVLRIAGDSISCHTVIDVVRRNGHHAEMLDC